MHRYHDRHGRPTPRSLHCRHSWRRYGHGGSRARRGDVRAAILALLAERPMHGYEMIKELEQRTDGAWKPSAGSIYPTLQLLEDEGLIGGTEEGGKRRFELTEEGATANAERGTETTPWEEVRAGTDPEVLKLAESLKGLNSAATQALRSSDESVQHRVRELLDESRRGVYAILAE